MSVSYAREMLSVLATAGYEVEAGASLLPNPIGPALRIERFRCRRFGIALLFEILEHGPGEHSFHLEIESCDALSSPSFALDSWKVHKDSIEFRYATESSTGSALTFVLDLAR